MIFICFDKLYISLGFKGSTCHGKQMNKLSEKRRILLFSLWIYFTIAAHTFHQKINVTSEAEPIMKTIAIYTSEVRLSQIFLIKIIIINSIKML